MLSIVKFYFPPLSLFYCLLLSQSLHLSLSLYFLLSPSLSKSACFSILTFSISFSHLFISFSCTHFLLFISLSLVVSISLIVCLHLCPFSWALFILSLIFSLSHSLSVSRTISIFLNFSLSSFTTPFHLPFSLTLSRFLSKLKLKEYNYIRQIKVKHFHISPLLTKD